jgi:hypothetical protein
MRGFCLLSESDMLSKIYVIRFELFSAYLDGLVEVYVSDYQWGTLTLKLLRVCLSFILRCMHSAQGFLCLS